MKKKLLLLCFNIIVSLVYAQDQNEEIKKRLANAFKISDAMNARYAVLNVPGEYIMKDGKITGQYYLSSSYSTTYKPGNVHTAIYFPYPDNPKVILKDGNCTFQHIDLNLYVTTDAGPNSTRIEKKNYAINGFNQKVREFFIVVYDENRIKSVNEGYVVVDKKSGSPLFEYVTSEASYTWKNEHDVTITSTTYYNKKKEKDTRIKISSSSYQHSIEKNKRETTDNTGTTTQYLTTGNETTIKTRKKGGEFRLEGKIFTDGEKVVKSEGYSYDENTGAPNGKSIIEYTLQKSSGYAESETDLCTFTMIPVTYIYDAQGNLTEERREGKFRKKNADGTWTDWAYFRL